jgi:ribosome-associated heat shock protein Hsp15
MPDFRLSRSMQTSIEHMRVDKWLWVARFFKTRSLAAEAADRGRVDVNGQAAKPARELRPGDTLVLRLDGGVERSMVIRALSLQRGPAAVAQTLYEETADSLAPEPAHTIEQGRPTKRDRRELERTQVQWRRWSASVDDDRS